MDTRYYFNDAVRMLGALNKLALNRSYDENGPDGYHDIRYNFIMDAFGEYNNFNKLILIKEKTTYDFEGDHMYPADVKREVIGTYGDYEEQEWRNLCFDMQRQAELLASDIDPNDPCVYAENQAELDIFYKNLPKAKIFKEYERRGKVLKKIPPSRYNPDSIPTRFYGKE